MGGFLIGSITAEPAAVVGAVNGTSIDGSGNVVLGQDINEAGNPGQFTSDRQLALNGFGLVANGGSVTIGSDQPFGDPLGVTPYMRIADAHPSTATATVLVFPPLIGVVTADNTQVPRLIFSIENQTQDGVIRLVNDATGNIFGMTLRSNGPNFSGTIAMFTPSGHAFVSNDSSVDPITSVDNGAQLQVQGEGTLTVGTVAAPLARLTLQAGTNLLAPFSYVAGPNTAAVVDGAKNFDGTNEFLSAGGVRYTLAKTLKASASLDFPLTIGQGESDLTIALTGAADGDVVALGVPINAIVPESCYTAFVSAANTVTVRFNNYSILSQDPNVGTFTVCIIKY